MRLSASGPRMRPSERVATKTSPMPPAARHRAGTEGPERCGYELTPTLLADCPGCRRGRRHRLARAKEVVVVVDVQLAAALDVEVAVVGDDHPVEPEVVAAGAAVEDDVAVDRHHR